MAIMQVIAECIGYNKKYYTEESGPFEVDDYDVKELLNTGLTELISGKPPEVKAPEDEDLDFLESVPDVAEEVKFNAKKKK